jgi:hypothetical protein
MVDLLFVLVLVGLFGVTAGFVELCDRMLGSDEEALGGSSSEPTEESERLAA